MKNKYEHAEYVRGYESGMAAARAMGPTAGWTHSEALLFALIGVLFGIFVRGWL